MGTNGRPKESTDRQNWHNIFNGVVQMLRIQHSQLEALAKDRKLLEDRIKMQHDRWVSDIQFFEDQISQMNGTLLTQDMESSVKEAKFKLLMGLKQRDVYLDKLKQEYADKELEDFKALLDLLSKTSSDLEECCRDSYENPLRHSKDEEKHKKLKSELRRLKLENEKLALEKTSEVSALLKEKAFVWNQYKIMEEDFTNKLKSKDYEVEQAKDRIQKLYASMKQLELVNNEKDVRIAQLTDQLTKLGDDSNKLIEDNSRLSEELALLRKPRSALATPILNPCKARRITYSSDCKNNGGDQSDITVKKESSAPQVLKSMKDLEKVMGSERPKRKGNDVLSLSEPPKLFTSSFKVPKLKNPSPRCLHAR